MLLFLQPREEPKRHMLLSVTRFLVQKKTPNNVQVSFVFTTATIAPLFEFTWARVPPLKAVSMESKPQSAENKNSLGTEGSLCEVQLI